MELKDVRSRVDWNGSGKGRMAGFFGHEV